MLLATACGGASDGGTATSTGSTAAASTTTTVPESLLRSEASGLTGLDAELSALRVENGVRLAVGPALDFFASVFGPVPGTDATRFEFRPGDGTMAMMEALAHWSELTPEQQQAVRVLLGYPGVQSIRAVVRQPDAELQAGIDGARASLAARVGSDAPFPIIGERRELGRTEEGERILGIAIAEQGGDLALEGSPDRCVVAFPPGETPSAVTVAHEVFHCFQYHLGGDVTAVYGGEKWIVEGSAEWAGAETAGIDAGVTGHFAGWVNNAGSMFGLDYPALGFYWVAESMDVDPMPLIGAMLRSSGTGAIGALGLEPGAVLNRIATSLARRDQAPAIPGVAGLWDFADPQVPPDGVRVPAAVTEGRTVNFSAPVGGYAWGSPVLFELEGGDRVQVRTDADVGTLQFFEKEPVAWSGTFQREFCLEPGGCRCGVDGEVDPGLEEGARRLIVAGGEQGGGPVVYEMRIPDPAGAFTHGTWEGTVTSSSLRIGADGVTGERLTFSAPFTLAIENGAVVAGSYSIVADASMRTDEGSGSGTAMITGVFTGCGFSPQMHGTDFSFEGTMTRNGVTLPLVFALPMSPTTEQTTFWMPAGSFVADSRSGTIDASSYLALISASGLSASGMEITYQATKTG
jgi:hypothetical protein